MNIRQYLSEILTDNQLDWLFSKYFEIQVQNMTKISRLNVFRESKFADLRSLSYLLKAVDVMQGERLINASKATKANLIIIRAFSVINP